MLQNLNGVARCGRLESQPAFINRKYMANILWQLLGRFEKDLVA